MSCSNCYNGCTEIVSDKCVKYTGVDVPALGIKNGDSLSYVEQALIEFLTATLDGTGIIPILGDITICTVVNKYLPDCQPITLNDVLKALIQAACDIQAQVTVLRGEMDTLNADYNVSCLSGVTNSSDTHLVVQAVINKLCQLQIDLTALSLDVSTNYVKIANINSYIAAYFASTPSLSNYNNRMVPYTIVPYYGSLTNFDGTGAGIGLWQKLYLCNGQNGTPDLRGRSVIGAISGVPGGPLSPTVDPGSSSFNFNYTLGSTGNGVNSITLTTAQMPIHTHTAVTTISPNPHKHSITASNETSFGGFGAVPGVNPSGTEPGGDTDLTNLTASTVINPIGNSQAHNNVHPVLATYYIMYIP